MFIFPLADGTINMPDGHGGYKECWYGEVVKRVAKSNNEVKYFKVNPVNDKVIGLDDIKIIRHGGGLVHGDDAMMVLVDFVVRWFQKDGGKCRFIHGYFSQEILD